MLVRINKIKTLFYTYEYMYIFSSFTNMHSRLFALCNIYKTHILNRTMNIVLHIQAPAFMKQSGSRYVH